MFSIYCNKKWYGTSSVSVTINEKTIIAYANTSGGRLIIGVDDVTKDIIGVDPSSVFQIMDKIANANCKETQF